MKENILNVRMKTKIDTEDNWKTHNPILKDGELGYIQDKYGSSRYKVGDGITPWNDLEFAINYFIGTYKEYIKKNEKGLIRPGTIVHITDDNDYYNIPVDDYLDENRETVVWNKTITKGLLFNNASNNIISSSIPNRLNEIESDYYSINTLPASGVLNTGGGTNLGDIISSNRSGFYTINLNNKWYNVISNRHRNGINDGTKYGLLIMSSLTDPTSDLVWDRQRSNNDIGVWQGQRTILDSGNCQQFYTGAIKNEFSIVNNNRETNLDFDNTNPKYQNKVTYHLATSSTTVGKPSSDALVLNFAWDNAYWGAQLALRNNSGEILYRGVTGPNGNNTGPVYNSWSTVLSNTNYTSHINKIRDIGNSNQTTFAYSKSGLGYNDFTWLAAWNGYELRAVNKSTFSKSDHTHASVNKIAYRGNHGEAASGTSGNSPQTGVLDGQGLYLTGTYNDGSTPVSYGNIINVIGAGSGQLLCQWQGSDNVPGHLLYRSHRDINSGGWSPWVTILDSNNWSNYVTLSSQQSLFGSYARLYGSSATNPYLYLTTTNGASIVQAYEQVPSNFTDSDFNNLVYAKNDSLTTASRHYMSIYSNKNLYRIGDTFIYDPYNNRQHIFTRGKKGSIYIAGYDGEAQFGPGKDNWMYLGVPNYRWKQIYAVNSSISTSDRRQKKEISYIGSDSDYNTQLSDNKLIQFINKLKPVVYKRTNGDTFRPHHGLIAQDVEEILQELNIDHAAFIKSPETEEIEEKDEDGDINISQQTKENCDYIYGLRYEEFISDIIRYSQLLYKELQDLKEKYILLESKVNS